MSKWDKEGFGDQERPNSIHVTDYDYINLSDYPPGVSSNFLGARVGTSDFPNIPISVAKQLLAFDNSSSQDIYNNFI